MSLYFRLFAADLGSYAPLTGNSNLLLIRAENNFERLLHTWFKG